MKIIHVNNVISLWNKLSFQYKISAIGLLVVVLFSSVTLLYLVPVITANSIERKKQSVKDLTEVACGILESYKAEYETGISEREVALARGVNVINHLRYGKDLAETFWIIDMDGNAMSLPNRE